MSEKNHAPPVRAVHGFTLIEVVVAMVVLAIGLLGLQAIGIATARAIGLGQIQSEYAVVASAAIEQEIAAIAANPIAFASGPTAIDRACPEGAGKRACTIAGTVVPNSIAYECHVSESEQGEVTVFDIQIQVIPTEDQRLPWQNVGYALAAEFFAPTLDCS